MKNIANSKFKVALTNSLSKNFLKIPVKNIRSVAGIRNNPQPYERKFEIEDVIGLRVGQIGTVEMNKEHKCNILTESFMEDVRRSLEAMEIDEDMKAVILRAKQGEVFSYGTDLNYMYYKKKSGEIDKIEEYLKNLYNFHNFIATYHKPLIAIGNGVTKGSGVSLLSSSKFAMTSYAAVASFPEVGYGYIPDSGNIFLLSRMEGEMGVFLALTGYDLQTWDLVALGLARDLIIDNPEGALSKQTLMRNHNESYLEMDEKWPEIFQKHHEGSNLHKRHDFLNADERRKIEYMTHDHSFVLPWERDNINDKDKLYSSQLHKMVAKEFESTDNKAFNFRDFKGRRFTNTTENFYRTVYPHLPTIPQSYFSLAHVVKDINRLFRFDTVKEIYEALKEETSPFADWCVEQLESKSPLALEVTLRMLRNAKKMNYYEIITQEINVAKNMVIKNKDFDIFMENKISHTGAKVKFPGSINDITKEEVDQMFADSHILANVQLDVKTNALLPHRYFSDNYPDCFSLWINETPRANEVIRKYFDYEIKHFLIQELGIDMRDTNLTIEEVRKVIAKIETNAFTRAKHSQKISYLLSDSKFLNEYFEKRKALIDVHASSDGQSLKELVNKKINKVFKDNFKKKTSEIYKKCAEVRDLEKRRTWVRLKRWLFMNRIMEYKGKKSVITAKRIEALGNRQVFVPYKLDVNFRDVENPFLKKSAFYELAGLFEIKHEVPTYALKFATSDPQGANFFKYVKINKEKLNEIKEKLKSDPDKFLNVWNSVLDKEAEKEFENMEDPSLVEYERVYRLRHEGHSTLDKLPYYKEYVQMRENWMQMKKIMTESLRKVTLDMIYDIIEKEDVFNKSLFQLNKEEETIKKIDENSVKDLYNLLSSGADNSDLATYASENKIDRVDVLKQNIKTCIENDEFYKQLSDLPEDLGDFSKSFKNKVYELTQNIILNELVRGKDVNAEKPELKNFSAEEIEANLRNLFNNSSSNSEKDSDFKKDNTTSTSLIDWLYLKYGTHTTFSQILKKSKFTVVSLVKNLIENELFMHNNHLLNEVKENKMSTVKAIYDKEKSMLEDVLRKYYEVKINIMHLDLMEKFDIGEGNNTPKSSIKTTIEDFISKMKELTFSHLILRNSTLPPTFDLLFSEANKANKEREMVELYVSLRDVVKSNTEDVNDKINFESVLNLMTKVMKASDWYSNVEAYVSSSKDIQKSHQNNLDSQIENFVKHRFNEIVYENKSEEIDFLLNKRKLNEIVREKFNIDYLQNLLIDNQEGKVNINEDIYQTGVFSDFEKLNEKIDFYSVKIDLTRKMEKLEKQFNISNLKEKYSDYHFNAPYYIHKVLCNLKNVGEIYKDASNIQKTLNYGKFLFEIKKSVDEVHSELSIKKSNRIDPLSFNHLYRLRNVLFNQKNYIQDLESLHQFIQNKIKYNNNIIDNLYDDLSFTQKYEVNMLVNDIQCDSEKLYRDLKAGGKELKINREDYLIPDSDFLNRFKHINLDEFYAGVEGGEFGFISEMSKRINEIFKMKMKSGVEIPSFRETEDLVKKLVTYEVMKGKNIINEKENLVAELIEKERAAYDELVKEGKIPEEMIVEGNRQNRAYYLNTLIDLAQISDKDIVDEKVIDQSKLQALRKEIKTKMTDAKNLNTVSNKVLRTIQGLKHLKYIQQNTDKIFKDSNNMAYQLDAENPSRLTFSDYIKKLEHPGLKFNSVYETIFGRQFSIQELIMDDHKNTLSDFSTEKQFDKLFSSKLPVELVKAALEALDARLIKAFKVILASEDKLDLQRIINHHTINKDYLAFRETYNPDAINQVLAYLEEMKLDSCVRFNKLKKFYPSGSPEEMKTAEENFAELNKTIDRVENSWDTFHKIDAKGESVLVKGSIAEKLIFISSLSKDKRGPIESKIMAYITSMVPMPNFTNQHSLLKYVYDYHVGTLQVAYENSKKESERRINALNNAMYLEKIEKLPEYDFLLSDINKDKFPVAPNTLNQKNPHEKLKPTSISFGKHVPDMEVEYNPELYHVNENMMQLYTPENLADKIRIQNYRGLAWRIYLTKDPNKWNWMISNGVHRKYSLIVYNELNRYLDLSYYLAIKQSGEAEEIYTENQAMAMLLTEDFRKTHDSAKSSNRNLREMQYNLHNEGTIGFSHLEGENSSYDRVLDEIFGEYLCNKKESLKLAKEKLQEQKDKYASLNNITLTNPYEVLRKSQQAYFEMKKGSKNDTRMKFDIDTYLKMSNTFKEYPTFYHSDMTEIVDLDNATSQALYGDYASIPKHLVDLAHTDPDIFHYNGKHILDKNEEEWLEDQIEMIVNDFFLQRSNLEKTLTRDELFCLDQELITSFTQENVIAHLKKNLNHELLMANLLTGISEHERNSFNNKLRQTYKAENKQFEYNRNLKDENAYYQHQAYVTRLQKETDDKIKADLMMKKRTTGSKKVDKNIKHPLEIYNSFEQFYAKDLLFNQVYKDRKEDSKQFLYRYNANQVGNLGRTQLYEPATGKQKVNYAKSLIEIVEDNPHKVEGIYRKKAGEIVSLFKEKADKLDQIDRFNAYMANAGKKH